MKKTSVGFSAKYLYKVSVNKETCIIKMGRKPHEMKFITDAKKRGKQYGQRLFTLMRKRYELEVMCGAKIHLRVIRGQSKFPSEDACDEPKEDNNGMHGAEWYEDTKPKNIGSYYKPTQEKSSVDVPFHPGTNSYGQSITHREGEFSARTEAGSNRKRPSSPVHAVATWLSPIADQNEMEQITDDDVFSQLFATTPVALPRVETPNKKVNDEFFGERYKDILASRNSAGSMFRSTNNHMFAPGSSDLSKPSSPPRGYASILTTLPPQQSLLGYSPIHNSGSMRVPSPRPKYVNIPLLTHTTQRLPSPSSISQYDNLRLPSPSFETSSIDNSATIITPKHQLIAVSEYSGKAPPEFHSKTGSPRNSARLHRINYSPEPPLQPLPAINSAHNYRLSPKNENQGLLSVEQFFGMSKPDIYKTLNAPDLSLPKSPSSTTSALQSLLNPPQSVQGLILPELFLETNSPLNSHTRSSPGLLQANSPTSNNGSEMPAHLFFGTHKYNNGGS